MAAKERVRVVIEPKGVLVTVLVETEKRGEMTRNLEVEAKTLELIDKRTEGQRLENDDKLSTA